MNGQTALQTSPVALFSCRSGFSEAEDDCCCCVDAAASDSPSTTWTASPCDCDVGGGACGGNNGTNQFQLSIIDPSRVLVTINQRSAVAPRRPLCDDVPLLPFSVCVRKQCQGLVYVATYKEELLTRSGVGGGVGGGGSPFMMILSGGRSALLVAEVFCKLSRSLLPIRMR